MSPNKNYTHEGRGRAELRTRAILTNRSGSAEGSTDRDGPKPNGLVFSRQGKVARVDVGISDLLTDPRLSNFDDEDEFRGPSANVRFWL